MAYNYDYIRRFLLKHLHSISFTLLVIIVGVLIVVCVSLVGHGAKTSVPISSTISSAKPISSTTPIAPISSTISSAKPISSTTPIAPISSTISSVMPISSTISSIKPISSTTTAGSTTILPNSGSCVIDPLGSLESTIPLIIRSRTNALVYPEEGTNKAKMNSSEQLDLVCSNINVMINGKSLNNSITVVCKSEETFVYNETDVAWNDVKCLNKINPTISELKNNGNKNDPNINCYNDKQNQLITIGFPFYSNFLSIVYICFNATSKMAIYSNYNLTGSIQYAANLSRTDFKQDNEFYNNIGSIKKLYKQSQITINHILKLDDHSTKYINNNSYIEVRHLAANTDMYYAPLQTAVNRYINTAPQWNTIKSGNWNQTEADVRDYASKHEVDLQIWTGTFGNAALMSNSSQLEPLYLFVSDNKSAIPVPEVFWKIVFNPLHQSGIILLTHNNPYENNTNIRTLCTDVSDNVKWLKWDKNNFKKGYSYACNYTDKKFHTFIPFAPTIAVNNLLQ